MGADNDSTIMMERALLACLMGAPSVWQDADLTTDHFFLGDHRQIWQAICTLHADGSPVDTYTVANELKDKVSVDYVMAVAAMLDGGWFPENFKSYVRAVRQAAQERAFQRLHERLGSADHEQRVAIVEEMNRLLRQPTSSNWRGLFHNYNEVVLACPPKWKIRNFCEEEDLAMIGGPSSHGKTLLLLSICRAFLTGEPLFDYPIFEVAKRSERVLYLIPEVGLRAFRRRLEWFRLLPFVEDRLFIRTLSCGPNITLSDPRLQAAAEGADIFLDTAIRFSTGDELKASDNRDGLANGLFALLRAGAQSIICAHHAPKESAKANELTLENCLRGSGDIGAMCSIAYGIRQEESGTNRIRMKCIKPRDVDPIGEFEIQGRPYISDVGDFRVVVEPSNRAVLDEASTETSKTAAFALFAQGESANSVAEKLKERGLGRKRSLISQWQQEFRGGVSQSRETPGNDGNTNGSGRLN